MKKKQEQEQEVVIESVDQLQALCEAPLYCEFRLDGNVVRVACKRVSQDVDEAVRAIKREAQPPWKKERNEYDYNDPGYLAKLDLNNKTARALLVYSGCPMVAAKRPGLTNKDEIHRFVKTLFTENILELIALTVTAGGMELIERANFTSTGVSGS